MRKSIDKAKLLYKTRTPVKSANGLQKFLNLYDTMNTGSRLRGCLVTYHKECFSPFGYRYSFSLQRIDPNGELTEGVLFIRHTYNGGIGGKLDPRLMEIEYNPNKLDVGIIQDLLYHTGFQLYEIKSLDFAIDIPVPVNNVHINVGKYDYMLWGASNPTRYLRPKARNGRLKVYNKSAERAIHNIEMAQTTRVEVTIKNPCITPLKTMSKSYATTKQWEYITDSEIKKIQECCDSLNSVWWYEDLPKDPLLRLLLVSNQEERNLYIKSCAKATSAKLRKSLRACTSQLEYDFLTLYVDLVKCLKECNIL